MKSKIKLHCEVRFILVAFGPLSFAVSKAEDRTPYVENIPKFVRTYWTPTPRALLQIDHIISVLKQILFVNGMKTLNGHWVYIVHSNCEKVGGLKI